MPKIEPTSGLIGATWLVPGIGKAAVVTPNGVTLTKADSEWPNLRRSTDWHHVWRWAEIMARQPERFAVVDHEGAALGLWCSAKTEPIALSEGRFYRLDYLEAHPQHRGSALGAFLLALVATRALELGAEGMVLAGFPVPGLQEAYERVGAVQRCPQGWNHGRRLLPFVFGHQTLVELKELGDGLLEDTEA